ncbi:MAG TPA: hypothetical protein VNL16_11780 [Chloroflexota bacterium]|nr:hypothetical protein [Chloroflexota bacterium]
MGALVDALALVIVVVLVAVIVETVAPGTVTTVIHQVGVAVGLP